MSLAGAVPQRLSVLAHATTLRLDELGRPAALGRLDVSYLLESRVERHGDGIQLYTALVSAGAGRQRWSGNFVTDGTGVRARTALADQVAAAVSGVLIPGFAPRPSAPDMDETTLEAYLSGRYLAARKDADSLARSAARLSPCAGSSARNSPVGIHSVQPTRFFEVRCVALGSQRPAAIRTGSQ